MKNHYIYWHVPRTSDRRGRNGRNGVIRASPHPRCVGLWMGTHRPRISLAPSRRCHATTAWRRTCSVRSVHVASPSQHECSMCTRILKSILLFLLINGSFSSPMPCGPNMESTGGLYLKFFWSTRAIFSSLLYQKY